MLDILVENKMSAMGKKNKRRKANICHKNITILASGPFIWYISDHLLKQNKTNTYDAHSFCVSAVGE